MRYALACLMLCLLVGALAWLALPARGQHVPVPVYTRVIATQVADFKWDDAAKGSITGTVKFSAKRAAAPVVVFLVRDGGEGKFAVPEKLSVSQEGARFSPSFAVLVRGQKCVFLNDEKKEISHNVYFLGAAEVDLGIFDRGQSAEHQFDSAGEVSMHCSIHKNMDGKFFVAPSPAFAVIEPGQESFEIRGVPAGKYKLKTWQRQKRFKDVELEVTVQADKTANAAIEMTR